MSSLHRRSSQYQTKNINTTDTLHPEVKVRIVTMIDFHVAWRIGKLYWTIRHVIDYLLCVNISGSIIIIALVQNITTSINDKTK